MNLIEAAEGQEYIIKEIVTDDEELNALAGILESVSGKTGTLDMRNYTRENGEVILKEP